MTWDRVVTIEDFWDSPRGGVAFHSGKIVVYKSLWDDEADDYSGDYGAMPIDENLLPLIEERWSIWIRWSDAFHAGHTTRETHPALPQDQPKYQEISNILEQQTKLNEAICIRLCAEFMSVQQGWNGTEVRWYSKPDD